METQKTSSFSHGYGPSSGCAWGRGTEGTVLCCGEISGLPLLPDLAVIPSHVCKMKTLRLLPPGCCENL